jgi:hypothetical protein
MAKQKIGEFMPKFKAFILARRPNDNNIKQRVNALTQADFRSRAKIQALVNDSAVPGSPATGSCRYEIEDSNGNAIPLCLDGVSETECNGLGGTHSDHDCSDVPDRWNEVP